MPVFYVTLGVAILNLNVGEGVLQNVHCLSIAFSLHFRLAEGGGLF